MFNFILDGHMTISILDDNLFSHSLIHHQNHPFSLTPSLSPLFTHLLFVSPLQCTSLLLALGRDEEVKSLRQLVQALQGLDAKEQGLGLGYDPTAAMM